ncbi:hypothetical protein ASG52_18880 [Methylobacterium sp. Leaf456]|nr:hypothetical protein ASG52_18880 [Methylobacterium sp. Leaf456]
MADVNPETIVGDGRANTFYGGKGNDSIDGGAGADRMVGGAGSDTYYVDNVGDRAVEANGAAGTDLVYASVSYALGGSELENLTLTGTGNLNGRGNSIANILIGNGGANVLDGKGGADTMIGGAGSDTYYVDNVGDRAVEANGAAGTDLVYASVSYALGGSELENLTLTGAGNLYGRGNSIANILIGNGGANALDGKGGADTMIGGAGSDTYYVDNVGDRCVEANGAAGTDHVYASVSYALGGSELENLTLTGTGNLFGRGNSIANTLTGNGGANVLDGKGGADTMIGGAGSDAYYVDNVGDRCVEANGAAGTDHVYASVSYALGGSELENLTLTGTGNLNGTGNSIANILIGNGGANVLDGKGGADRMIGGAGSDTYHVDNVGDRCVEANGAAGTDLVYASVSYSLGGSELENLTLTGASNLKGTGNSIANTLTGNSGANVLDGRGGADILIGGAGSDTFVFATDLGPTNVDHLRDFSAAADTIHLARSIFSSLTRGELAETAFKDLSLGHVDADDRILYDKDTGALSYDSDGSGAKAAIQFAVIDTKATLTHADFFVV